MPVSTSVRLLTVADLPQAVALSRAAGWNQTAADWQTLLNLAPDGCFGVICDSRLVATASLVCYGTALAWIGMVLTHADYRRRGYARLLMEHLLELTCDREIATVKLDATDQGQALYEALGFRVEQTVQRWGRQGGAAVEPARHDASVLRDDIAAFGADRSQLLQRLAVAGGALIQGPSYLLHRPGERAHYLGPCLAESSLAARALLTQALHQTGAAHYFWDLLPANREAVELARDLGFSPLRHLTRMVRGEDSRPPAESRIYAIAGFEWG